MRASEFSVFGPFHACRVAPKRTRVIRGQLCVVTILLAIMPVPLGLAAASAQTDFPPFWNKFRSAVTASHKSTVAEMTKFPLSMPYLVKAVKNKREFLRRYSEIFKGDANAGQCFTSADPQKESARTYAIYCPFKDAPNDHANTPVRFIFELTKSGWKFTGLDNINE